MNARQAIEPLSLRDGEGKRAGTPADPDPGAELTGSMPRSAPAPMPIQAIDDPGAIREAQPASRALTLRRALYVFLVLATSAGMTGRLWLILRIDGTTVLEVALLLLYAVLSARVAASFWLVCFGVWFGGRMPGSGPCLRPAGPFADGADRRIAVVMPVFNEDVERCTAALRAIRESVLAAGGGARFDFFLLSDSNDPARQAEEQRAWQRLQAAAAAPGPIFYRHRAKNVGRKSGNIADFCRNWGGAYSYMIILDADSLMSGAALLELVGLMEANPRAGLIQAAPRLVGRETLFARIQQFASSVYAGVSTAGVAALDGPDGNYWGHNAIIRVSAFVGHCGLPRLPGREPLGGEILSHDFVEAAFLRRAGWDVWLAPHLEGSYEEVPPTLLDYLKRDRRWCQGNLQHVRLLFARGLRLSSRLHFASGALAYLASPLWLALLIAAVTDACAVGHLQIGTVTYLGRYPVLPFVMSHVLEFVTLFCLTMGMLFGPKIIGVIQLLRDRDGARAHGGRLRLAASAILETLYSTLLAPVFMLSHSGFVLSSLVGGTARWDRQQRKERNVALGTVAARFAPHTLLGIVATVVLHRLDPGSLAWFSPLLLGLVLAIPLAKFTGSLRAGLGARRHGLFLIPSETQGLPELTRVRELLGR